MGRPPLSAELNQLLVEFAARVPGIDGAIIVSVDGRPLAVTPALNNQDIERLTAVTTGLRNLSAATARLFSGGPVAQSTLEMRDRTLVMTVIPGGACLSVLAQPSCEISAAGYAMAVVADQAAQTLAPRHRRHLPQCRPPRP
jgi:hypothetical protein